MDEEYSRASGDHQRPAHHGHHEPASSTELMESAKMMAAAVQSAVGGKTSSIDKARVAGAAENLLGAAQRYGKLDETSGIGKYVGKAEDYLHKYHSSDSQHTGAGTEGEDYAPVSDHGRHRREEDKEEDYAAPVSDHGRHRREEEDYAAPVSDHRRAPVSDHDRHRREEDKEEDYAAPVSDHGRHRREEEDYAAPVSDHRRTPVSDHGRHRREEEEEEEETGSGGGSGVGDYINMAKGFFK